MKKHLKRLAAPKSWPLKRKGSKFVTKPRGSHKKQLCLALGMILRDVLKHAKNAKEAKKILNNEQVLVDGTQRKDLRFGLGLMDVLEIPKTKQAYRMILTKKGKLGLIEAKNKNIKPCKIIGKKALKKGGLQINLHDGKNLISDKKTQAKVGDTLVLELPDKKIAEHLALEKGCLVYLTGGSHIGESARVEEINPKTIKVKIEEEIFETARKLAFVIGKQKPIINLEK